MATVIPQYLFIRFSHSQERETSPGSPDADVVRITLSRAVEFNLLSVARQLLERGVRSFEALTVKCANYCLCDVQ